MSPKKVKKPEVELKALQKLGKEMNEIGFDPPINCKETDYDELRHDILINANDLQVEDDDEAISDKGKATLKAIGVGPWLDAKQYEEAEDDDEDEEPEKVEDDEEEVEEDDEEEDEEPAPKKTKNKKEKVKKMPAKTKKVTAIKKVVKKVVAKKAVKEVVKKTAAKKNDQKKPGVIASIISILKKEGPITKEKIVKILTKQFPERDADSMAKTVNVQIPNRIQNERDIQLKEVEGKGWKVKR